MRSVRIHVGQWVFFPEYMIARSMHNWAPVFFDQKEDGSWVISAWQCPAQWMLDELAEWFWQWIKTK